MYPFLSKINALSSEGRKTIYVWQDVAMAGCKQWRTSTSEACICWSFNFECKRGPGGEELNLEHALAGDVPNNYKLLYLSDGCTTVKHGTLATTQWCKHGCGQHDLRLLVGGDEGAQVGTVNWNNHDQLNLKKYYKQNKVECTLHKRADCYCAYIYSASTREWDCAWIILWDSACSWLGLIMTEFECHCQL